VLVVAIRGGTIGTVALCVGGMALAISAGVLFVPAPAGAGVRDVILTLVLSASLSSAQALAVVVASRVMQVGADVLLAGLSAVVRAGVPRRQTV
jgi:glycosyltransferase 2 family protein